MTAISVSNPFNAPVYHEETVTSTMDISRELAAKGNPHGTVITADFQQAGRGRGQNRIWQIDTGLNLPFTILLRYPCIEEIPPALTLRTGLAVSLAIEDFAPPLKDKVQVKWPNDILIGEWKIESIEQRAENYKKAAGILCEADGGIVHIGIGVNVAQKEFPVELQEKATSISLAAEMEIAPEKRFFLLEKILARLFAELETTDNINWKPRLERHLYKKGRQVTFIEGVAGSNKIIKGSLTGINNNGEILIIPNGKSEACAYTTGELSIINC